MVLDRPDHVEAELVGEARQAELLVDHLAVADAGPAMAGKHHLHADIHGFALLLRSGKKSNLE